MQGEAGFIRLNKISKSFGPTKVFNDLSLSISTSSFGILLGANGSGKSTLLGILGNSLCPDSGQLDVPASLKLSYLSQDLQLYRYLTVKENLAMFASVSGVHDSLNDQLSRWHLLEQADKLAGNLSRGWQQRVNICRVFMSRPDFLVLDEPTSFLDSKTIELFKVELAKQIKLYKLKGYLIATHDLHNLLDLAGYACLLDQGQMLAEPTAQVEGVYHMYQELNR